MNEEKDRRRIALRWGVSLATILPVLVNIVLLYLCNKGKCGRDDALWSIVWSFRISIGMFAAALIGTGWMVFNRNREPLWILIEPGIPPAEMPERIRFLGWVSEIYAHFEHRIQDEISSGALAWERDDNECFSADK